MKIVKAWLLITFVGCTGAVTLPMYAQQMPGDLPGTQTDNGIPMPFIKPAAKDLIKVAPLDTPAPIVIGEAGISIVVKRFKFVGNQAESSENLEPLVAAYLGKALTLGQLNEAADAIRRFYRNKGWFLAQAYIPAQSAKNGVIEIAVLEGRIDKITINVAADAPISAAYAKRLINASLHAGQAISENGIERPLLLLRDVPRVDAKSVIDPGGDVGTATIVVNVVKDPDAPVISGLVEADNYGSRVSGMNRLGGEINVNNPYGVGDQLSLRGFIASAGGNGFGRAAYSLPVGPWGTRVGVSIARLDYVLGQEFAAIKPNGIADVYSVNAAQPLIRSKNANLFVQLIAEKKQLTDQITTPYSSEKSALSSVRLQLNGDARDDFAGTTLYSLSVMRGNLSLNNAIRQTEDQDAATGAHTNGGFDKLVFSAQRLQQLVPSLNGMFSVSGQITNKNLHPAEKFSIGGENTVRAFPVGELVGDQGYTATTELRYAIPGLKIGKLDVVSTLFYDYGQVTQNHDNSLIKTSNNKRTISGYGLGLNLGYGDDALIKLAIAWPLIGVSQVEPNKRTRLWAYVGYFF